MTEPVRPPRKKVAFIKRGKFSFTNQRIFERLARCFPEYEFEEIDVIRDLLRYNEWTAFLGFMHLFPLYWRDFLKRRQDIRQSYFRTPYIFDRVRELIRERLTSRASEYAFTFQTQSLFDASIPGLPHFIYTDHTHLTNLSYPGFSSERLYAKAWIDREREVYLHADRVFVMSEHVRTSLTDHYGIDAGKSEAVFAGCNVADTEVPLLNDGYRNQTILFIGIDWERKGGPTLLQAFEKVLERLPDARLVIVGASPSVSIRNVTVLGKLPLAEVKEQLAACSVLCLPTRLEPFGIAVIEAYYHRIPVVATRIGAIPDMLIDGKTGHLVPPDNVDAVAEALVDLLGNPDKCRAFGNLGREHVLKRFTWENAAQNIASGIRKVLAEKLA